MQTFCVEALSRERETVEKMIFKILAFLNLLKQSNEHYQLVVFA